MPEFSITSEEIKEILQFSRQQGGSKYRQEDIYKLLDRVVARGPASSGIPEYINQALNEGDGVYRP